MSAEKLGRLSPWYNDTFNPEVRRRSWLEMDGTHRSDAATVTSNGYSTHEPNGGPGAIGPSGGKEGEQRADEYLRRRDYRFFDTSALDPLVEPSTPMAPIAMAALVERLDDVVVRLEAARWVRDPADELPILSSEVRAIAVDLRAADQEVQAEICAYQGRLKGGLPGWHWDHGWMRDYGADPTSRVLPPAQRQARLVRFGMIFEWQVGLDRHKRFELVQPPPSVIMRPMGYADTPRMAMRDADRAAAVLGWWTS